MQLLGDSRMPFCPKHRLVGKTDSSEQREPEAEGRWHLPYICFANEARGASESESPKGMLGAQKNLQISLEVLIFLWIEIRFPAAINVLRTGKLFSLF